jgi:membrane-associated phospholipid phosphatase
MNAGRLEKVRFAEQAYLVLPLGFSAVFAAVLFFSGDLLSSPTSIMLLLLTPIVGVAARRWRRWRAWLTLVMIAMSYEALAGVIDAVADTNKLLSLFDFDKYLWGFNLTGWFQTTFSSASMTNLMALLYQLLMPVVFVTSFFIWHRNRHTFGKFVTALLLTSYAALVTFLLLPTLPPWLGGAASNLVRASGLGSIPSFLAPLAVLFEPNEFAAFPSLHAAYMVICTYFLLKLDRRIGGAAVLLTAGILLSTLYLGQHYLVDLIAGVVYAIVPCVISERLQIFETQDVASESTFVGMRGRAGLPVSRSSPEEEEAHGK